MIETLSWMAIKSFFKKAWAWCKKYWQFLLGLSVGIVFFILTRDRARLLKTFQKFKETSDTMIENSIEIEKGQDRKTLEAVDKYKEDLDKASSDSKQRDESISAEKEEIRDSLLERERKSPGTIASEINKELKDIN